ncbi:hypothetical protein GQ55_6G171500 [Panicum hallii var. hallii]|uniref:Uncharacterized protein n=1 Tax=Panicum hallii var. hallii TaxID=1504633 RepID=A0A2T7D6T1_9POAL|nr:hypothetical protein GQ55_6G171500 [Panicum hallii var. hallii]
MPELQRRHWHTDTPAALFGSGLGSGLYDSEKRKLCFSSHQGNKGLWCKPPTGSSHHGWEPNHMRKKQASANQPPVPRPPAHGEHGLVLYF